MEYPKIETLYNRDKQTFKVIPGDLRLPEFGIINRWYVTEKVDGTNVRIMWSGEDKKLTFGGRTDRAQMPTFLLTYLMNTFKEEMFTEFEKDVILFGEGYGEKIQKAGGNYKQGVGFCLFDVYIDGWWLEPASVGDIALTKFGLRVDALAPYLGFIEDVLPTTKEDLFDIVGGYSLVAARNDMGTGVLPEGIVARSFPLLFNRKGERVMWKLKFKDYE